MKNFIALLVLSLFMVSQLNAKTYYVSPVAIGSGDGTQSNPYTVLQANTAVVAGDTIIVLSGTYNFSDRFTFTNGGTVSQPVVWITSSTTDKPVFVANHNATVDAFVIGDDCIEINGIIFYGQPTATRSVIQVSGDYVSLKNGESHYRAGGSATDNDNIRGDNSKHFLIQNWLVNGSAWNAINLQTTTSTNNTAQGLRHLTFDNVEITNILHHNAFNIFPNTTLANPDHIDSITIKNCYVHDNSSGTSALLSRYIRKFDIYNNVIEGDLAFASGGTTPADTFDISYPDRKSIIAHNTFIGTGAKQAINNWVANGLEIKNNVFYGEFSGETYLRFTLNYETNWSSGVAPGAPLRRHEVDYNIYYQTDIDAESWVWNGSTQTSFASWKSTTGFDTHSQNPTRGSNPLVFVNVANGDYRPADGGLLIGAGTPLNFITTDKDGNPRDPNNTTVGAFEYTNGSTVTDNTPPTLLGASVTNSTTIELSFSEALESSSALNKLNYTINNGIVVNSVSLSTDLKKVTLSTTQNAANQIYTVVVSNVKDLAGNIISSTNNSTQYSYVGDTTPPNLLGATVINPTTIELSFSEALESSSALNKLNYTINNGIVVNSVSLSTDLKKITLSTTQNAANQIYTVVVSNVKDLTGNIISSSNTATYQFVSTENLTLLSVNNVIASVVPEALHTPAKTIDGKGVNDGDPDSRWAGDTMPEWLLYDFGSSPTINLVRLSFYDWNSGRIYNYSLQTSNDLVSWSNVITNAQSAGEEWTAQIIGSVNARYLKVIFNSNNQNDWAGLWEAQFWGSPANNIDVTPPDLKSAAVLNSTAIALLFSEPLETTSAQTKTNYSINNGIVVNSAVLSVDKKSVTLNTTQHVTNQNYTVTVSNVKDLAGNIISTNNSAQYSFVDNTVGDLKANVKIYLQGPFLSGNMMTELSGNEFLPASQPYNVSPWFYNGTEVLGSGSSSSTDWVLVELRSTQNPAQVISRRACLLRNDGRIIEPDGTLGVTFKNLLYGSYYIAVFHRNHLAVMTSVPVSFSPDNSLYDFTNALTKAYGQSAMAEITTGVFGMYAGDGDGNGTINEIDRSEIWSNQNGTMGYLNGDFNLDSGVTVKDINDYWNFNEGKFTQVP
jgi:methionine-rich copper-binding protein CopC